MPRRLACAAALTTLLAVGSADSAAAKTNCGSFSSAKYGIKVSVYRISGMVSCATAKSVAKSILGASCRGETIRGYKCSRGATEIGEPAASGFTLRKGSNKIEGRVR